MSCFIQSITLSECLLCVGHCAEHRIGCVCAAISQQVCPQPLGATAMYQRGDVCRINWPDNNLVSSHSEFHCEVSSFLADFVSGYVCVRGVPEKSKI